MEFGLKRLEIKPENTRKVQTSTMVENFIQSGVRRKYYMVLTFKIDLDRSKDNPFCCDAEHMFQISCKSHFYL